jgi:hypothetical protein
VTCHHDNITKQDGAAAWDIVFVCYSKEVKQKANQKTGAMCLFTLKAFSMARLFHGNMDYFRHVNIDKMETWCHGKSKPVNHLKS